MKIKDNYIRNAVLKLSYDIWAYNNDYYPKDKITLQQVLDQVTKQFKKHHIK